MSTTFDEYADDYSEALQRGLSVTGESQEYFARERIRILAQRVADIGLKVNRALDFGCGQGSSTPILRSALGAGTAIGAEISEGLLEIARRNNMDSAVSYVALSELNDDESFECVYMNGVLHHVPVAERAELLRRIYGVIKPGGLFGLWENNPLNPGTRYIMSRIPFDRDAVTLTISQARAQLRNAGFSIRSTDTAFFFPRALSGLRPVERMLSKTGLGGQYLVVARKPLRTA